MKNELTKTEILTFENPSQASEVHLIRAVEHNHVLPQTPAHVFGGFRFARPSGSRWSPAHVHSQRLRQRDVAPETQGRTCLAQSLDGPREAATRQSRMGESKRKLNTRNGPAVILPGSGLHRHGSSKSADTYCMVLSACGKLN